MKNKTFFTLFSLFSFIILIGCGGKKTEQTSTCTEFTPECEIQKKWSAIKIASKDSTSYDGFGNPTREGWYLYSSISKQVFPLSVISLNSGNNTAAGASNVPAHNLGEDGADSMIQPRNWCIKLKIEKLQTNLVATPGLKPQEIEVLCLSGGEISLVQFMGNEVAGRWKTY
jgi:hypothetical protein